jgi:hypothetical protein
MFVCSFVRLCVRSFKLSQQIRSLAVSFLNRPTLCQMPIATAQNDATVLRVKKRNTQYLKVVIFKYFILTIENKQYQTE